MRNPLRVPLDWLAQRPGRAFLILFGLSFAVQMFYLTLVDPRYIRPHTRWELQSVAVSLAETGQFADPYMIPTGPTAHLPPIPPAITGLIYRTFGLTLTAGYIAWVLRSVFYAALWGMLPWLADRIGLRTQVGVLAGLGGVLIPRWPGHGEALTAVAMALLMVAFALRWTRRRRSAWGSLLLGLACGVAFHVQPALLPVVLGWVAFELWWRPGRRTQLLSGLIVLGIVLACLPWCWRNYRVFDALIFIRGNLGLELRMGNHDGAAAAMDVMDRRREHLHPRTHEGEANKVEQLGEVVYMRQAGREAVGWIVDYPSTFAALTASRLVHWWLGPLYAPPVAFLVSTLTVLTLMGAWLAFPALSVPQRAALLIPLLTYPLIYYVVAYMPRYREPVNWIFLLLAGAAVWTWIDEPKTTAEPGDQPPP